MTDYAWQIIADYACVCGEGPVWHALEKCVYWTDIPTGRIFRYSPDTGRHEQVYEGRKVGGMTVQADGSLLLFRDRGNIVVFRDGKVADTVIESLPIEHDNRFNDVAADPQGRVFCGTGGDGPPGRLYRLDPNGNITQLLDNIGCSNGIGWTLDYQRMYYTDTGPRTIYQFDYDPTTGAISNQRPWLVESRNESPDGLTVDAQGSVWSARWNGGCVVRYAPDASELTRLTLPTPRITSMIFGGEDYAQLFITSAGGAQKSELGDAAGALFCITPDVKGKPDFLSRIGLE